VLLGLSVYSGQPDNTDRCSRPEVSAIRGFHCTLSEVYFNYSFAFTDDGNSFRLAISVRDAMVVVICIEPMFFEQSRQQHSWNSFQLHAQAKQHHYGSNIGQEK